MMCKNQNLDFFKIRNLMRDNYKRNTNIPSAGFTAGPCLLKDTMQLSSFYNNNFLLGQAAMNINEGFKSSGRHQATLTASTLSSGTYFCVFTAGDFQKTQKVLLLK